MKREKYKRILVIVVLVLILLASTYAWFTTNKNVTINALDVNVATTGSIEISANAIDWKAMINSDDLLSHANYTNAVNQIPADLLPVSSSGQGNNGKLNMFYGAVGTDERGNYTLTATQEQDQDGRNGRYIAFDIFFRVKVPTTVYLSSASIIRSTASSSPNQTTGIENATRIAMLNLGTKEDGTNATTIQAQNDIKETLLLEPNSDAHTATGAQNASRVYGKVGITEGRGNPQLAYKGIKQTISTGVPLNSEENTYFADVTTTGIQANFFEGTGVTRALDLEKGITKVRMYMWIEGQDVDCENNASGANLKFDIQLTTESV